MPDLHHMLQDSDLDFLSRVARFWGIELPANSFAEALDSLVTHLNEPILAEEIIQSLPVEAQAAWQAVLKAGRMPSAQFMRRFGELRIQGEGWRKREEPDLHPVSPTEMLWYRALIGRGIFGSGSEPQEYIYVPDEWVRIFSAPSAVPPTFELPLASAEEHAFASITDGQLIDRLVTLLAELRKDPKAPAVLKEPKSARLSFELALLSTAGVLKPENLVDPEKSREILEKPAGEIMLHFFDAWRNSASINDLRMLPGLDFEGTWVNDVHAPRQLMLEILQSSSSDTWISIPALIAAVKRLQPDFQRPAGDYDSWFIRRKTDGQYLRGFGAWDEVEGYLIRNLIRGPLHWLGLLDLGSSARGKAASSFRLSKQASRLLSGKAPILPVISAAAIKTTSDGKLYLPASIQAALHYQVARFCVLVKATAQETSYVVTSDSLKNAVGQGLKPTQLTALLKRAGVTSLAPGFGQLLERYEKFGVEARLERTVLLTVEQPDLLEALRKDARFTRYLEDVISPTSAKVKPGSEDALLKLLAEMGRLAELHLDV